MSALPPPASHALAVTQAIDAFVVGERLRVVSALAVRLGDLQCAEDAVQEALAAAVRHWGRSGVPDRPAAWMYRVALRKAIDELRRQGRRAATTKHLAALADEEAACADKTAIPDERLALVFACCHPALEPKTRVALTLRSVCGLSTVEVARAFLDQESTMGQRLSRARNKIKAAGIPFAVPAREDWRPRMDAVLTVIYLVFTTGYVANEGPACDLRAEALFLARLLVQLVPGDPEVEGCLALLLLTNSRSRARRGQDGQTVPPAAQDRNLWDHHALQEGQALIVTAMQRRRPGPFQIKAAIAACHCESPPDWPQIAALYGVLRTMEDTPIVRLNEAVAVMEVKGPQQGLAMLAPLAHALSSFQPFHAARAAFLARAGCIPEACAAYDQALALTTHEADRAFLKARQEELAGRTSGG